MNTDFENTINQFFTDLLGAVPALTVEDSQTEIQINLQLDPKDSGMLIGYRGETLNAIQLILSMINQQATGSWKPVRVNVNDYRQKRQQSLEVLAQNAAAKAVAQNQPVSIPNLTSYERRIVHSYLSNDPSVTTVSEGEAPYRTLIVSPVKK